MKLGPGSQGELSDALATAQSDREVPAFSNGTGVSIALFAPGWPAESFFNGVATYAAKLRPSLPKLRRRVKWVAGVVHGLAIQSSWPRKIVQLRSDRSIRCACFP
jgi:hypothetical protein